MSRSFSLQDHSNSARIFLWFKTKYFQQRICIGPKNNVFYTFFPSEELVGDQAEHPTCTSRWHHPSEKPGNTQRVSTPTKLGTAQRRMQKSSPKRVTQTYHRPLPSWLGTRTLHVGTSFIWDSIYCTNTDYHLKCAAPMNDCLWTAVIVVTYEKSHFLARYSVNPQGSWTLGTRSSFWKETKLHTVTTGQKLSLYLMFLGSKVILFSSYTAHLLKKERTEINV